MTEATLVHVHDVSKAFLSTHQVLIDVNLEVHHDEIVAIVGPTGCGKSTLLRLIAGLDMPDQGTVERPQIVEMLFQSPTLLPWRTVRQNISLPLELGSATEIPQQDGEFPSSKITDAMSKVELLDHADKYPHQLSGGMQMRTALARTLVTDAQVLLLDEPFAAVDEITRQELHLQLFNLKEASKFAAIIVTHDLSEAVFLADRIVVLQNTSSNNQSMLAQIDVSFDGPRTSDFRYTDYFVDKCKQLHSLLSVAKSAK